MSIDLSNYEILTDGELKCFNWRKPRDIELAALPLINLNESITLQLFRGVMFVLMFITCLSGLNIVLDYTVTSFNSVNISSLIISIALVIFLSFACFMLGCVLVNEILFKLEHQIKKALDSQDFEILDVEVLGRYVDRYIDGNNNIISKVYTVVKAQEGKVYLSKDYYSILDANKSILLKVPIKTLFNMKSPTYTYFVVRY